LRLRRKPRKKKLSVRLKKKHARKKKKEYVSRKNSARRWKLRSRLVSLLLRLPLKRKNVSVRKLKKRLKESV
jgi:hypothetical protein